MKAQRTTIDKIHDGKGNLAEVQQYKGGPSGTFFAANLISPGVSLAQLEYLGDHRGKSMYRMNDEHKSEPDLVYDGYDNPSLDNVYEWLAAKGFTDHHRDQVAC